MFISIGQSNSRENEENDWNIKYKRILIEILLHLWIHAVARALRPLHESFDCVSESIFRQHNLNYTVCSSFEHFPLDHTHTLRLDYELCRLGCLFYSISLCRKFNWSKIHSYFCIKSFELLGCLQRMLAMPTDDYSKRTSSYRITSSKWEIYFSSRREIQIEQMAEQLFTFCPSQR